MGVPLETKVLRASEAIDEAAKLILAGEVVGVPTETVYGLAANALDERAVQKIFEAKGRPQDNPLIVHIADYEMLSFVALQIPEEAAALAAAFWPGPLSLIVRKSSRIPASVSAGLDTIAVRMPAHPDILRLIRATGVPLAAPSANLSGLPSPTKAEHVLKDMQGRIRLIVDGGHCSVGVESTVLDITHRPAIILRPGAVTSDDLQKVIGPVRMYAKKAARGETPPSPGMKYRHYAPKATVRMLEGDNLEVAKSIRSLYHTHKNNGGKPLILCAQKSAHLYSGCNARTLGAGPEQTQRAVFDELRRADNEDITLVLFHYEPDMGAAVHNRVSRAAENLDGAQIDD